MRENGMQGRQKWRFKPRRIAIITRCPPEGSIHRSDRGTLRNVMLKSDHLNSNGVDPDSSTTVLIEKCVFDVDDDGIAIKVSRDQDGWRVDKPCARIFVRVIDVDKAQAAISFTTDYHGYRGDNFLTWFHIVQIDRLRCHEAFVGVSVLGAQGAPMTRVRVSNRMIEQAKPPLRSRSPFSYFAQGRNGCLGTG
jgi:hypothetical protein